MDVIGLGLDLRRPIVIFANCTDIISHEWILMAPREHKYYTVASIKQKLHCPM